MSAVLASGIIGIVSGGAPPAMAAQKTQHGMSPSRQRALAQYKTCKPLRVFRPSAGFRPLTASAGRLRNAGFPGRPSARDARAYRAWTKAMSRPLHFTDPKPVCGHGRHSATTSDNWGGYVVPASGNQIGKTTSAWVQPSVPADSNYSDYKNAPAASFWTGTGEQDVIQAGCDSVATGTPQYHCWTENYPEGTIWEGPAVQPGQTVYVTEQYDGDNQADYYIENESTGEAESFTNPAPDVGLDSADFINERIKPYYLPSFGSVPFTGNSFTDSAGNTSSPNSGNADESDLIDSSGTTISSPGAIGGNGDFTEQFSGSG